MSAHNQQPIVAYLPLHHLICRFVAAWPSRERIHPLYVHCRDNLSRETQQAYPEASRTYQDLKGTAAVVPATNKAADYANNTSTLPL